MRKDILFIAAYGLLATFIVTLRIGGGNYERLVFMISLLTPLIALFYGIRAVRYFGMRSLQGKSALFITACMASWLVGDVLYNINGEGLGVSDIVYVVGYPLFALGVIYGIRTVYPDFFAEKRRLAFSVLTVALAFIGYFYFFPVAWNGNISFLENMIASGYVMGDFTLLAFVILLLSFTIGGTFSRAWISIGLGAVSIFVADIFYALTFDVYALGSPLDLGWSYGYLLIAAGLASLRSNAEAALEKMRGLKKEKPAKAR